MRNPLTLKQVDEYADAEYKRDEKTGRVYIVTKTQQSYDAISDMVRNDVLNMPEYKNKSPEEIKAKVDEIVPNIQKTTEGVKPVSTPGGSGGGGVNLTRIPESHPRPITLPDGRTVNVVDFSGSQASDFILPDKMLNLNTGKDERVTSKEGVRVVSMSPDTDEIFVQRTGGLMKKGGNDVFLAKGKVGVDEKANMAEAKTIEELKGVEGDKIAKLNKPVDLPEGAVFDHSEVVRKDGKLAVQGYWGVEKNVSTGEKTLGIFPKSKKEKELLPPTETELVQPTSGEEVTYYSLPLRTFGANVLGAELLKHKIGNETWSDILNRPAPNPYRPKPGGTPPKTKSNKPSMFQ
jgi:hypothetical protein